MRKPGVIAAAIIFMLVLGIGTVLAHPPELSEERLAYVKRDGLMHLIHGQRYILQEMLVGIREVDQAEYVRAARSLAYLFSMIPSTFEQNLTVHASRAKPEIWENWDDFVARAKELQMVAEEVAAAAEDQGAKNTLQMVRKLYCGDCHDSYRK